MPDDVFEIRRIGHKAYAEIKTARPCNRLPCRLRRIQHQNALIGNGIIPPVSQRPAAHLDGRPVLHRQNRFDKAAERPHQLIAGNARYRITDKLISYSIVGRVFVQKTFKTAATGIKETGQPFQFVNCRLRPQHLERQRKGNALEPFAIQGSGLIRGRQYVKNTERRENSFISGECDIHDVKHSLIIDTKCSWEIKTHPFFREEAERKVKEAGYDWQMQGYMWLFDCEQAEIDFWLFPCPEDLIGQYGDPEKLIDAIERIPLHKRVTTVTVKRDPEAIERIQERVAVCQEYYRQLMQEQK